MDTGFFDWGGGGGGGVMPREKNGCVVSMITFTGMFNLTMVVNSTNR